MSEDGEAGRPTAGTTPVAALRTWWERWRPSVTGLIVAALILASAMLMRVDTGARLLGYPALAIVLFMIAAGLGLTIVVSAWMGDRRAKPREEHGPR